MGQRQGEEYNRGSMAGSMRQLGAHCVFMVTDRGQAGFEHPGAAMLDFIGEMLRMGISADEIKVMIRDVPQEIIS